MKNMKDLKLTDLNPYNLVRSREENFDERRKAIKSLKAKANSRRSISERSADWLTSKSGSMSFLMLNVIVFVVWIIINTGHTSIKPFDPYPFSLMTTAVSLEAIILAIVVLMSQNREGKIGELREEIDLRINTVTEEELTKLISLTVLLLEKQGVKMDDDPELRKMLRPINSEKIEKELAQELSDKV